MNIYYSHAVKFKFSRYSDEKLSIISSFDFLCFLEVSIHFPDKYSNFAF